MERSGVTYIFIAENIRHPRSAGVRQLYSSHLGSQIFQENRYVKLLLGFVQLLEEAERSLLVIILAVLPLVIQVILGFLFLLGAVPVD